MEDVSRNVGGCAKALSLGALYISGHNRKKAPLCTSVFCTPRSLFYF